MGRVRPRDVLEYWFNDDGAGARFSVWFDPHPETGAELRGRFEDVVERALAHRLQRWCWTLRGRVAMVLLLDVFPRHLWAGTPRSMDGDQQAQAIALEALASGRLSRLPPEQRAALYLPLLHAEDDAMQDRAMEGYARLVAEYGERFQWLLERSLQRRDVIQRFGRFPNRNPILGRDHTEQEEVWLATQAPDWVLARLRAATGAKQP